MLIREQGLDCPERLRVLMNNNIDDNCNVMRKSGGKNDIGMPDRGQQVSAIAQKNLKLSVFLFHHRWRCTFNWDVMKVHEETVHLLSDRRGLKASIETQKCCLRSKNDIAGMM